MLCDLFGGDIMNLKDMGKVQKMTFSVMIMALYVVLVYITQSFSFGAYQIRIATSVYALAYLFPFLVLPLGLANSISNTLFGGLGLLDTIGGGIAGILTTLIIAGIRKMGWHRAFIVIPLIFVPGLLVPLWLSYILKVPYAALAVSLCIGQIIPALCGTAAVSALARAWGIDTGRGGQNKKAAV